MIGMTIRYDEVLGPLREAYDGGAAWRDGVDKEQWKLPPRFFSWRTDEQLLDFAADARFDVMDFHSVDTDRGFRFQSLTLRCPDGNPDGNPKGTTDGSRTPPPRVG
jgi:hypothetical protein